jgi:hypothetical protein
MNRFTLTAVAILLIAPATASADDATQSGGNGAITAASKEHSQTIRIMRMGSQRSREGPAEYFTGPPGSTRCSQQKNRHAHQHPP